MRTRDLRRLVLLIALSSLVIMIAAPSRVNAARNTIRHPSTVMPSRAAARLGPISTVVQTWNNCGPASIAEVLGYWGIRRTQDQVAAAVRADNAPWGMAPFGVPAYARSVGSRALLGANGTEAMIKALVSNGFPVIVSQWVSASDHVRHYRPIVAYDNTRRVFFSSDPYLGAEHIIRYADFVQMWAVSDNRFLVIAPPSRQGLLEAVLNSSAWSKTNAFRHDLAWQQRRLSRLPMGAGGPTLRYYGLPSIAWDQLELGNPGAAQRTLRQASLQGANHIVLQWISGEIAWRSANHQLHATQRSKSHQRG